MTVPRVAAPPRSREPARSTVAARSPVLGTSGAGPGAPCRDGRRNARRPDCADPRASCASPDDRIRGRFRYRRRGAFRIPQTIKPRRWSVAPWRSARSRPISLRGNFPSASTAKWNGPRHRQEAVRPRPVQESDEHRRADAIPCKAWGYPGIGPHPGPARGPLRVRSLGRHPRPDDGRDPSAGGTMSPVGERPAGRRPATPMPATSRCCTWLTGPSTDQRRPWLHGRRRAANGRWAATEAYRMTLREIAAIQVGCPKPRIGHEPANPAPPAANSDAWVARKRPSPARGAGRQKNADCFPRKWCLDRMELRNDRPLQPLARMVASGTAYWQSTGHGCRIC